MVWKKPNVKHFRVFGYLAYAHILDENRKTLDPKSQACTFLGYYDKTKAYRLYNPKTYKVIVYRYIILMKGENGIIKISLMMMNLMKIDLLK